MALPPSKHELLRSVSAEILEAQRPLRVLRALVWTDEAERAFLQREGAVTEPRFDIQIPVQRFDAVQAGRADVLIVDDPIH